MSEFFKDYQNSTSPKVFLLIGGIWTGVLLTDRCSAN